MSVIILKAGEKKEIAKKVMSRIKIEKGLNTKKYCGKIKLTKDPLAYQKNMRNESIQ